MHKGIILLSKAGDRIDAESETNNFLEPYGNGRVWDWFQIGGRWSGLLSGYSPEKDPANLEMCNLCNGTGDRKDLSPPSWKKECGGCNGCHGTGQSKKWPTEWAEHDGNIMPLANCVDKVNNFLGMMNGRDKENLERAEEQRIKWNNGDKFAKQMYGYYLKQAGEVFTEEFSFEANVFNVEEDNYSIPTNTAGWWAIIIDMHN